MDNFFKNLVSNSGVFECKSRYPSIKNIKVFKNVADPLYLAYKSVILSKFNSLCAKYSRQGTVYQLHPVAV